MFLKISQLNGPLLHKKINKKNLKKNNNKKCTPTTNSYDFARKSGH